MPTDSEQVKELFDRHSMTQALLRYCRGTDRCDAGQLAQLFHADATVHHGAFRGTASQFVADYVGRIRETTLYIQHAVANVIIEFDGERAASETSFVSYLGRDVEGIQVLDIFGGRYLDQWERRGAEQWRVSARTTVHDWHTSVPRGTIEFPRPVDAYAQGSWAPDDPSYVLPGPHFS